MEPLSPRSVNVRVKPMAANTKRTVSTRNEKEKNHAPTPPSLVVEPPRPDEILGKKYETGALLGKGGFAICHQAKLVGSKYGSTNQLYALKIVRANLGSKRLEEKFCTELQIHSKMSHPNIVEFHRAFSFQGCTYVVLELCSQGSIMDMIKKRKCLSLPEIRRHLVQLCGAIKYLHARNVIHRDLKIGNIFLDRDMNIKIGDFGLAALLVEESEVKGMSRRTTMCGTPNYLAPEILEKSKKGHDHKVDIWAVGIILFVMLTGCPPFQSNSQDDIYRKVKALEYSWPKEKGCYNDIPDEAKNLVATLLKANAEERPSPDEIVSHPFFTMRGGDTVPRSLGPEVCQAMPKWIKNEAPRGDVMAKDAPRIEIEVFAKQCGVGKFPGQSEPFEVLGEGVGRSLYQEFLKEAELGQTPTMPLPEGVVYYSKKELPLSGNQYLYPETRDSFMRTDSQHSLETVRTNPDNAKILESSIPSRSVQSHAALLRSEAGPRTRPTTGRSNSTNPKTSTESLPPARIPSNERIPPTGPPGELLDKLPLRPTRNPSAVSSKSQTLPRDMSKVTRSAATKGGLRDSVQPLSVASRTGLGSTRVAASDKVMELKCPHPEREHQERATWTKARIAKTISDELSSTKSAKDDRLRRNPSPLQNLVETKASSPEHVLIGPDEVAECVPGTEPKNTHKRLHSLAARLRENINDAANNKEIKLPPVSAKMRYFVSRPVVVKWVDYTNKFGIGYILANGSVGCVFKGFNGKVPTCVLVPFAEEHLKKRKLSTYTEKYQIVSPWGAPIQFFENCGDDGFKRVLVRASQYRIKTGADGIPEKLAPGADKHDHEKRRQLNLWDKFSRYMTQTLGKGDDESDPSVGSTNYRSPSQDGNPPKSMLTRHSATSSGPFVKFYQRLGNVGIWGFGDGSFQFNFPDHTKLYITEDGGWVDFYHLSVGAAKELKSGGMLQAGALEERGVLSYPIPILLKGSYRRHDFADIIISNEFTAKVEFVRDVVEMWCANGGLGCIGQSSRFIKWEGLRETVGGSEKLVWVSVGAKGGDERYELVVAAGQ